MNNTKEIVKGSIVKYNDGWMRVRAIYKTTVNLGSIFGSKTTIKQVPIEQVKEDYDAWSKAWQQSETYQSM